MNSINLVGRLATEPNLSYTSQGIEIATVTIAVKRAFKTNDGVEADFIRIKAFKKTAELLANITKGREVGISGSWQTGKFENNQGQMIYTNECIVNQLTFIGSKADTQQGQPQQTNRPANNQANKQQYQQDTLQGTDPFASSGQPIDIDSNDLPF
ncbi:single-stranded DNA-binding protein [Carnobacterium maltaromaticum]|uniref:single-stranded DNA-binding protein n=1 Tax=Carnobacterium maltaromaticum TaxID=2751 RepID=UPI0039AFF8B9